MKGFKNVKRSLLCGVATVLVTGMAAVPTSVTPAQENYVSENQNKHVINNISYDKNKVSPGESFTLSLSLDNIDKIEYGRVSIGIVGSDGGVSELHEALFKKNNGRLEATFEVDNTWKNGKYDLAELLIYDTDGSRTWRNEWEYGQIMGIYFPEEIKRSVLVNGSKEQNPILPTIKDIKITPSTAKPGDVVEIEMNLSDKITDDKEFSTVTFIKSAQYYGLDIGDTVILKPKNDTTLYGRTTISDKWKKGTYVVRIDSDSVNASGSYNEDSLTITDENNAKDSEAPEIKSVSLDKDHAKPGEEVKISVKASDASGLKKGEIVFRDVEDRFIYTVPLKVVSSDTLQGVIKPYNNYENGEYHISRLVVTDKYDNEKNIYGIHYEDYKINWSDYNISVNNDSFTISDSIKTDGFPLKKISFDKGLYKIGDTVNITAEAKSGGIDIPYAYVDIWEVLYGPGGGIYAPIETVQLLPNGNNGLSGSFTISNVGKHYSPDRGELYEPNNYYTIKRAKAYDLGNYTFYEKSWSDENEMFLLGYNDVIETEMSVSLDKKNLVLDKGKSGKLTATVKPDNAKDKTVTWTSSNTNVATVDKNGNVTAVNHGTAKITAKTSNGKTATCEVRVNFTDVASTGLYYYKPVYWAAENKITTGANGLFAPHNSCTREHAITFLWRMAGSPNPKSMDSKFKDITNKNSYSYKAIMWGTEKGIITGSGGKFAPNNTCTREQIVTMLWRLAGKPAPKSASSRFKDVQNKNSYSYNAILWASEKGITTGANGEFKPGKTCTRAEIVTFIYRYQNKK